MDVPKIGQVERKPVKEIIDFAEELLGMAKAGKVTMMIAAYQEDGEGLSQFMFGMKKPHEVLQFIGHAELLKQQLVDGMMDDECSGGPEAS